MRCVFVRSEPFPINIGFVGVGFHIRDIPTGSDGRKQQILKSLEIAVAKVEAEDARVALTLCSSFWTVSSQ
jgi:hypothetical protein